MDEVDQSEEADFDIEILTAEEATKIWRRCDDARPALAIGAFVGIRTAEVCRLDWSEVNLEKGLIQIKKGKAKTRSRRLVRTSAVGSRGPKRLEIGSGEREIPL